LRIRLKLLVLSSAVACLPATHAAAQATARPVTAADLSGALEATTRAVAPAVVEIFSTTFSPGAGLVPNTTDLVRTQRGTGSGVIVDPAGYIITNAHVVRGAQHVRVEIPSPATGASILSARSRSVTGTVIGIDIETDLAVVKVNDTGLTTLPFGDSDELRAGQVVMAFGSPLGLSNSVSLGIVSAVARQLSPDSPMIYVQTDASINPGNSGGPLVDVRGRLVGINTLNASLSGNGNDGLGFAAPSNIVKTVYEQIRRHGRVRRGDIGVRAQTITPVLASGLGLSRDTGVVLSDVLPGSPAARAGVRPGDIVLSLDGKAMDNGRQLQVNLYRHTAGDLVQLEVLRDGKAIAFPVVMVERNDPLGLGASIDPRQNLVPRLGILALTLDARIATALPALRARAGVVVVSTVDGAVDSQEGGLASGDVIVAVNRSPVTAVDQLKKLFEGMKIGDAVVVQLERGGELKYLAFTVE
jgi:serine protease Do